MAMHAQTIRAARARVALTRKQFATTRTLVLPIRATPLQAACSPTSAHHVTTTTLALPTLAALQVAASTLLSYVLSMTLAMSHIATRLSPDQMVPDVRSPNLQLLLAIVEIRIALRSMPASLDIATTLYLEDNATTCLATVMITTHARTILVQPASALILCILAL